MREKKGNSLLETRRKNRIYIKDMIYRTEPVTRTDVANSLGLTLPTITTSVNEMIAEGILEEVAIPEEKLQNTAGRKPSGIQFVGDAVFAVGVELGPYETSAVLMNLNGDIIASSTCQAADISYSRMLEQVSGLIRELLKNAVHFDRTKLLGVGVGIAGYVISEEGRIRIYRNADWNDREIGSDLAALLQMPVLVDNNVRMRAIGYDMSQKGTRPDSFAYLYVSRGIACPILEKDNILTGYTFGAGEVGHMIICAESQTEKKNGKQRWDEHFVEDLAGEKAIIDACVRGMGEGKMRILCSRTRGKRTPDIKDILEAYEQGDPDVEAVLQDSISYLGIALANIVNLVNPGFVVVDAYMMKDKKLQKLFRSAAKKRFYGINEEEVRIFFLPFEHFKGAKGAAYDVIESRFLKA